MICEYVSSAYGVPACIGRLVSWNGRSGVISKDCGNYISVTFDDEKPGVVHRIHPKDDGLIYLGLGKVRRLTKSQERYARYKEVCECFESFRHFLAYDAQQAKGAHQ